MDVRGDVLAVDREVLVHRDTQRGVQRRPVLGDVDVLAGEHRRAALLQPRGLGKTGELPQQREVHQVLRQIDVQRSAVERQVPGPAGVVAEHVPQRGVTDPRSLVDQSVPFREGREWRHVFHGNLLCPGLAVGTVVSAAADAAAERGEDVIVQ